jgi:hypothetical protein
MLVPARAEGIRWPSCSSTGATAPRSWSGLGGRSTIPSITPWNGAYVAVVSGLHSTLAGYSDRGAVLGPIMPMDGLEPEDPEPTPG